LALPETDITQTLDQKPQHTITLRAVLLGVVTMAVSTIYMDYHAGNLVKSYLPVAVLIPFLGWVVLNAILKIIVPRAALQPNEILTIFCMLWVAGNLPAVGWALHSVSAIPGPDFFASPENRIREVIIPLIPKWLLIDTSDPSVRAIYTGLPQGGQIPWMKWVQPFFWWLVGCLALLMSALFGSVLFFRQWDEGERLVFPMSAFPVDMLETSEGRRVPDILSNKIFWIGFACTGTVIAWNILGYFAISLPRITLFDRAVDKVLEIGMYYPQQYLRVQPLLIGLAYLCPTDILFSMWFYNGINTFKIGSLNRIGFTVGLEGQPAQANEIAMLESNGALFLLVAWSLWIARGHLIRTVRMAISSDRSKDDAVPLSYRSAWIGWCLSVLALAGWCMTNGMTFWATGFQLVFLFVCYFGISKYAATTGFTFLNPAGGKGDGVIRSIGGSLNFTPASLTMMEFIGNNTFLGAALRTTCIPSITHILKMWGDRLKRIPVIWLLIPGAYIVGWWLASGTRIFHAYDEGGLNGLLVPWQVDALTRQIPFIEGTKAHIFDPQKLSVWLFGAGEAAVLTLLKSRFTWWPLHPIAVAFPERRYAFCLFIAWVAKVVTLQFGGVRLYRRSIPFWYGAICGYLSGIAVSSLIDAIWFPDGGHGVHGW
jgi:hypothetical protein